MRIVSAFTCFVNSQPQVEIQIYVNLRIDTDSRSYAPGGSTNRAASTSGVSLDLSDGRSVVWGGSDRGADKARILASLLRRKADVYDVSSPDVVTLK